jgi:glycosyltransferase involved in cell wall biosynthesis
MGRRVCILTSHPFWLEPLGSGAVMRSRYKILREISDEVLVLYLTKRNDKNPYPGGTIYLNNELDSSHVKEILRYLSDKKITSVYFSYDQFPGLAKVIPCHTVVETYDVLHLRQAQFERFGYAAPFLREKTQELASLGSYDTVISLNTDETKYLVDNGIKGARYIPPASSFYQIPAQQKSSIMPGFLGSSAKPNQDGLQLLLDVATVWPCLTLAGSVGAKASQGLSEHILNLGIVPDVKAFYERIDVALSPIRFGGGLKIKVFEALAHGRPVLATEHSIEGFPDGIRDVVHVKDDILTWTYEDVLSASQISVESIGAYFRSVFDYQVIRSKLDQAFR